MNIKLPVAPCQWQLVDAAGTTVAECRSVETAIQIAEAINSPRQFAFAIESNDGSKYLMLYVAANCLNHAKYIAAEYAASCGDFNKGRVAVWNNKSTANAVEGQMRSGALPTDNYWEIV